MDGLRASTGRTESAGTISSSARRSRFRWSGRQRPLATQAHRGGAQQRVRSAAALIARYVVRERVGKGGQALFRANAAMAAFMHVLGRPAQHRLTPDEAFPDPNLHSHVVIQIWWFPGSRAARAARRRSNCLHNPLRPWAMALGAWYHAALAHGLDAIGLPVKSSVRTGCSRSKASSLSGLAPSARAARVRTGAPCLLAASQPGPQ